MTDRGFPTRRLNNAYLSWAYEEVLQRASDRVSVAWQQGFATSVEAPDEATRVVRLRSGEVLTADLVLHALGHNGSQPSAEAIRIGEFAEQHGLDYVAPAFTADIDLDWVPAGEDVVVRGMGLAAVDLAVLLAEGRGGRFERDADGALRYLPSGREPVLHFGSRRGVPYRSKVTSSPIGDPVQLELLGDDFRERIAARDEPLDFERDIWPLVAAELLLGYYRELFTGHPDRVLGDWPGFAAALRGILAADGGFESDALTRLIADHVPEPEDRFEIAEFDRPLDFAGVDAAAVASSAASSAAATDAAPATRVPSGREGAGAVHRRVIAHIERDLRQRTRTENSAAQALFLTMLFSFISIAEIPAEKWNARTRTRVLPGRWHTFFSYLASGPPGERLEELVALADAGIVRFLGGDVELRLDEAHGRFVASGSAETPGGRTRSRIDSTVLIDAWLPEAQAVRSDNPLLRGLVADGIAEEVRIADAEHDGSTGQIVIESGGVLPGDPRQFALGPFTSIPGAGAFTRPGIDSLSFRLHDRCARAILAAAARSASLQRAVEPQLAIR
ncbi:FAD/NAD(P)-binding protein [Leucobacter soli]|uniref:FAD/NAD(P)-binding protein n=1 Tax=Leucobacter soli TaxID=2812850 RepID=UPI00361388C5